jgi:plastocyanin
MITRFAHIRASRAAAAVLLGLIVTGGLVQAATPAPIKLIADVGPSSNITLKKGTSLVKTLKPGTYVITVRDRSNKHNFRLRGPGVNRSTSVPQTVVTSWTVKLRLGTYTYQCDPHAAFMNGTFKVVR